METSKENDIYMVECYRRYLKLERGHSPNTIDAYMRDIDKLYVYLRHEGVGVKDVRLENLENFSATLADIGIGGFVFFSALAHFG